MPDTYISQFSGEEIDSALRAAQIISGASTPAELRNKLEIRGDTIPVSAEDSTLISEALTKIPTTSGGGVNPNLLDNWYFGNPVNQRNGYYIPAGVKYNTLSWTEAGTTDKAYPVIGYSGQDPLIIVNGTNYIVGKSEQVPGYCDGSSYSIDRWKSEGNIVVTLESDGISIENVGDEAGQFKQELPSDFCPDGTLVCISAIVKSASGDARLFLSESHSPWGHPVDFIPLQTGLFSGSGNLMSGNHKFSIYLGAGAKIKLTAVKLELGDTQTLAHKENEKWVLNEIPDFGEQLRRCQRYSLYFKGGIAYGWTYGTNIVNVFIPTPVTMRAVPSLVLDAKHIGGINTVKGYVDITSIGNIRATSNGVSVDLNNSNSAFTSGTPVVWVGFDGHLTCDL